VIATRLDVTKRTPLAPRGMVAAEHRLGAEVGAGVLRRGGNAVDAAIATAFAMTVVEPFMSTIAGSGQMLIHLARRGETVAVDFSACAPARAHEAMYPLIGGIATEALFPWPRVEGDANVVGHRAVAVPGSVAGLTHALARYGTMTLADALAPAITLAREGFIPDWYLALHHATFVEELAANAAARAAYLRGGRGIYRPPSMQPGDRVCYPDLARSLEAIAREGAAAFYRGAIADAIAHEMAAHGGLITKEDLAAYETRVTEPLRGRYRETELVFTPGATGGITALEILNVLGCFSPRRVGWRRTEGLHLRAEATKRAFTDRFRYLGDPAQIKAPWDRLADPAYARTIAADIRRAGGPARGPRSPSAECTTHVSVMDRHRNMVALTHTAVSIWGSRVVVPETGILLNNGMIWFDPEPGKPNSVAPGKRALVNMVPVLGFRRGEPRLSAGAPGGRSIVSALPQVLANLVDEPKAGTQAAVDAPRLHTDGGEVWLSHRAGAQAAAALARRGHTVVVKEETYSTLNFARPVVVQATRGGLEAGLEPFSAAWAAGH